MFVALEQSQKVIHIHVQDTSGMTLVGTFDVKLLPLPQPPLRARTDAQTNPSGQRATQLRSVIARVTLSQDRIKLLLLSHNYSNDMINSTSLNEGH
jgi:hypothetical protein